MSALAAVGEQQAPTILDKAVTLARRLVGSHSASLMLPGGGTDELQIMAASGVPPGALAAARVRSDQSVSGIVARTRQPLLHNGPVRTEQSWSGRYRSGSFISVPVPLPDGRCGILNVADPVDEEPFQPDDLAALQDFAASLARELDDLSA